MKRSTRNLLLVTLLVTATVFFSFGCASKSKTTQPEGTAEQPKQASEPSAQEKSSPPPPPEKPTPAATVPPSSPPPKPPEVSQPAAQRTTEIVPSFVNLRQGPGMDSKIIRVLKKGTKLTVLQEKAGWLRVQLEDGTEGWVGKAMTSEGAQPKNP